MMLRRSLRALGMAVGIENRGPLDHAGQFRRFRQGDLAEVLAQVHFGRLAETADVERAAPAQVDLVGVVLENLLFGELLLESAA